MKLDPEAAVTAALTGAALKSALVIVIAWALAVVLRRKSAALRHWVWLLALVGSLALPALTFALPGWKTLPAWSAGAPSVTPEPMAVSIDQPGLSPEGLSGRVGAATPKEGARDLPPDQFVSKASPVPAEAPASMSSWDLPISHGAQFRRLLSCLGAGWVIGSALLILRLLAGMLSLHRLARQATRIDEGPLASALDRACRDMNIGRSILLLVSSRRAMPMTWGLLFPKILLPDEAIGWHEPRQKLALSHELAHVNRFDFLAILLGQLACALYWFSPFVWLAFRQLRKEQEAAADDLVLHGGCDARDYAQLLLEVAKAPRQREFAPAVAMARPFSLEGRVRALLDPKRDRRPLTWPRATALLMLAVLLIVPAARLTGQTRPDKVPSAAASPPAAEVVPHVDSHSGLPADRNGGDPAPARPVLKGLPYRGALLQITDVTRIDDYEKCIDSMAADGFDTAELIVASRQENRSSARIFLDPRLTPTRDQLAALIKRAKDKKLRVVLMPIVLLASSQDHQWRGTIKPEAWEGWFDSYREMEYRCAAIAEDNHVDLLVVGAELVSSESHESEWEKTIAGIRERFHGRLTYCSNWDHYTSVGFWNKLDLIGMNSYWKLGQDNKITVDEIQSRWRDIQSDLTAFSNKQGKPIILLEVGWCSLANAANEPWNYTTTHDALDLEIQRKLYDGFFRSWYGKPNLGGFMMLEWAAGDVQADNTGYSPQGKPAELVLKEWLGKGPWEVK